jgi:hypothetical protein
MREYYLRHRERLAARSAAWRRANPEKHRESVRRSARKMREAYKKLRELHGQP